MKHSIIGEEYLLKIAMEAIDNMLSNTEQVTLGNGVDGNGRMYNDVRQGLSLAGLFLHGIKGMQEEEKNV